MAVTVTLTRGRLTKEALLPLLGRVDGILALFGTFDDDAMLEGAGRVPVVVIGDHRVDPRFDQIRTDNRAGMAALTQHLIQGRAVRRPAFIAGPRESPDSRRRVLGFADAVVEAGLDAPARPTRYGDFTRLGGRAAARAILEGGPLPDAVVCANDQTALGVMDVLRTAGLRVPRDVVVTGFDGIPEGLMSTPTLTTVVQPMLELGRAAVDAALRRIADPQGEPVTHTLPLQIVLRESCGCRVADNGSVSMS